MTTDTNYQLNHPETFFGRLTKKAAEGVFSRVTTSAAALTIWGATSRLPTPGTKITRTPAPKEVPSETSNLPMSSK